MFIYFAFLAIRNCITHITSLINLLLSVTLKVTMVEESSANSNKTKSRATRPKAVYLWTEADVQKWLRRHCSDYYNLYWERFHEHDITGRALIRINDNTLLRMGITNKDHREAIWREILKLRLKTDIVDIRDLERRHNYYHYDL